MPSREQRTDRLRRVVAAGRAASTALEGSEGSSAPVIDETRQVAGQVETTAIEQLRLLRDEIASMRSDCRALTDVVMVVAEQGRTRADRDPGIDRIEEVVAARVARETDPGARAAGKAEASNDQHPPLPAGPGPSPSSANGSADGTADRPVTGGDLLRGVFAVDQRVAVHLGVGGLWLGSVVADSGELVDVKVDIGGAVHAVARASVWVPAASRSAG